MNYLYVQIELFLRSFELFLSPLNFFYVGSLVKTLTYFLMLFFLLLRRIASENNVALSDVVGTGREGRVLKEDILNFLNNKSAVSAPPPAAARAPPVSQKPKPVPAAVARPRVQKAAVAG